MIICKICNPNLEGNGYCGKHSTNGSSYLESKIPKKELKKEIKVDPPKLKKGQKCWLCKKEIEKEWCWSGHFWHLKCKNRDSAERIKKYLIIPNQVDLLAQFLIENFEDEIGKGDSPNGEGAIEMAVRLLMKFKNEELTLKKGL